MNKMLLTLILLHPCFLFAESKQAYKITVFGQASRYLDAIEILSIERKSIGEGATIKKVTEKLIQVDLGLGEPIAKLIILHSKMGEDYEFRIEQQYETSLSLMDEGPHMDLLNWKHYVSEWKILESVGRHSFVSKEVVSDKFPKVTTAEIIQATKEQSARWAREGYNPEERWVKIARKCKIPTEYPSGVSISKVRLKISVKTGKGWKEIHGIDILVPMGC